MKKVEIVAVSTLPGFYDGNNRETDCRFWVDVDSYRCGIEQWETNNLNGYILNQDGVFSKIFGSHPDPNSTRDYLGSPATQKKLVRLCDTPSYSKTVSLLNELVNDLEELETTDWKAWDVEEYLYEWAHDNVLLTTTDAELKQMAVDSEQDARENHIVLCGWALFYLTDFRDKLREEGDEEE